MFFQNQLSLWLPSLTLHPDHTHLCSSISLVFQLVLAGFQVLVKLLCGLQLLLIQDWASPSSFSLLLSSTVSLGMTSSWNFPRHFSTSSRQLSQSTKHSETFVFMYPLPTQHHYLFNENYQIKQHHTTPTCFISMHLKFFSTLL